MRIYGLSDEELDGWIRNARKRGKDGLKITSGKGGGQP
jgi:hypothetical protein